MAPFARTDIRRLFGLLNDELDRADVVGEVFLVGGAIMCLAYDARPSTQDVDAFFRPAVQVRTCSGIWTCAHTGTRSAS